MELNTLKCLKHDQTNELFCKTCQKYICPMCLTDHDTDGHEGDYIHVLKQIPETILPALNGLINKAQEKEKISESEAVEVVNSLQDRLPTLIEIVDSQCRRISELKGVITKLNSFAKGQPKTAPLDKVIKGIESDKEKFEKAIKNKNVEKVLQMTLKTEAELKLAKNQESVPNLVKNLDEEMKKASTELISNKAIDSVAKMLAKCQSLRMVVYINDWKVDRTYFSSKMFLSEDCLTYGNTASNGYPGIIGNTPLDNALYAWEVIPHSLDCSGKEGFGIIEKDKFMAAWSRDNTTPIIHDDLIGFTYPNDVKGMKIVKSKFTNDQKYYVKVNMMDLQMIIFGPETLLSFIIQILQSFCII